MEEFEEFGEDLDRDSGAALCPVVVAGRRERDFARETRKHQPHKESHDHGDAEA